jgi:hypothetical protein
MFASAGIDPSSSGVYPNASATAFTPSFSDERLLTATAPYLFLTAFIKFCDIFLPSGLSFSDEAFVFQLCLDINDNSKLQPLAADVKQYLWKSVNVFLWRQAG